MLEELINKCGFKFRMSDQFCRYELDLIDLIKTNKVKLADRIPIADKEERRTLIRQVNKDLDTMNVMVHD